VERSDAAIVALAARQHSLVSARQLRGLGFDSRAIARRVARGWLAPRGGGVFLVGPVAGPWALEMAELLRCGPRAMLAHFTAAAGWEMRERRPGELVDLIVFSGVRAWPGVRLHRPRVLLPDEHVIHQGLRITTPARTIADLSRSVAGSALQRLIETAEIRRLATRRELESYAPRHPALRKALEAGHEPRLTRSEAERRLLELIRAAGLPAPRTNVRVEGLEVDVLWQRQRLIVEVDGFAHHGGRAAFERDRRRDARLLAAGYRVLRITWRQLTEEPARVVATIAAALCV
jgi:very-short-patch-repair endonuclease